MARNFIIASVLTLVLVCASSVQALERLKVASAVKVAPFYLLMFTAAQEKGFWQGNGLDAEWTPFKGSRDMFRGVAARAVSIGISPAIGTLAAIGRGVPVLVVADLKPRDDFLFWVRPDSPIRKPKQLHRAKVGLPRLGGTSHAFGKAVAKALGIELKFVGAGGITDEVAALKTGRIDVIIEPLRVMVPVKLKKEARVVMSVGDYLPREWVERVVFARRDFNRTRRPTVMKVNKAIAQTTDFVMQNRGWALATMQREIRYSLAAAELMYDQVLKGARLDPVDRKAIGNVRNFLLEYGIVPRDKMPSLDELVG